MRVIGIILVVLSLPALIGWLKSNPAHHKWAWAAIGVLPFTINAINLDAALISWAGWTGYAKGLVVTLLDTLALAIIATSRSPLRRLPFLGLFLAYIGSVALSLALSSVPMSSAFYLFQLVRVLIVFVAVAAVAPRPQAVRWIAFGLAAGAIFQAVATVSQRAGGVFQASGTMGHQNLLGMMLHFVLLPLLALLLAGERSKLAMAGVAAALLAIALGASRGSIGFSGIGIVALVALSLLRRPTLHKWKMTGFAAVALAVTSPLMLQGLDRRFDQLAEQGGYDERAALERAARAIWADHPFGVGANQYVVVANANGYSERAGVVATYGSRSAKVHDTYLLVAAETGWLGLLTLVTLLSVSIAKGLSFAFRNRRDYRGEIVLGATLAVMVTATHSFYEWVFVSYQAQYVFAIALGIIAGMIRQRRRERVTGKSRRPSGQVLQGHTTQAAPRSAAAPTTVED
jgi:O-antigen ligase